MVLGLETGFIRLDETVELLDGALLVAHDRGKLVDVMLQFLEITPGCPM